MARQNQAVFKSRLKRFYGFYTGGFIGFLFILAILEQMGMPNQIIGYVFLLSTIALYAIIGIRSRTMDVNEYYVVGRRVPAFFNGMATGADWMSAASFIGMAGTLYSEGYDGLAYIMGWTGGYCLVALFLAPYLRKFGQFTIPDFLGARYGGNIPRTIGVFAAIICSFTYVIAQIYGVGLITSRFTGLEFQVGVFVGLAGILVCSFLGGMRAVTWTQVAQYIILIVAYMIPVVWLSVQHTGNPVPQIAYGQVLQQVTERENVLNDASTPDGAREAEVRAIYRTRQADMEARLKALESGGPAYLAQEAAGMKAKLAKLRAAPVPDRKEIEKLETAIKDYPLDPERAREKWKKAADVARAKAAPIKAHAEPFAGAGAEKQLLQSNPHASPDEIFRARAEDDRESNKKRKNFLALVLCLMVGTAALPHILIRYYTTPSVKEARQSVFWSLFFIVLLYFTAPALAVLAKFDIYTILVGSKFSELPSWVNAWAAVDKALMSVSDLNKDGIVQLAEVTIGPDLIVLATPEIAGLPFVISGLVAAGGLASALSTADGLLLTIANALSHDVYYKMVDPHASGTRRLAASKALLLLVAIAAAWVTSHRPGDILFLVGSAFSLAASGFFPALVLGVFWRRANKLGAILGMLAGLGVCMYYMYTTYPFFGVNAAKWWDIEPIAAGIFGIPVGILGVILGSLISPAPSKDIQELVDHVRYPNLEGRPARAT
ncbi:cation acetate symporter [Sulfurimicrobium lacus]|uniref:Cation acetate symporter n=1 Tax=Sulfurimicrobium lacus TaxID=2715678 RepID=A0A6F8VI36_9PROT|nr:sodium:solute symporter family protein [Sulfurimicrobium lacus]BCB28757.1 cation acetate symporter [Sulfurimicrobium lacus]